MPRWWNGQTLGTLINLFQINLSDTARKSVLESAKFGENPLLAKKSIVEKLKYPKLTSGAYKDEKSK